jgi:hypothetical protein
VKLTWTDDSGVEHTRGLAEIAISAMKADIVGNTQDRYPPP